MHNTVRDLYKIYGVCLFRAVVGWNRHNDVDSQITVILNVTRKPFRRNCRSR
ncbi:hypothetical protein KPSA1_04630 [Pseudomonas syringae pv. actinidiae]|uniref:Uncharacterized protein n=1 Tax=Pseudomonas syringae pv. actinidiae TaxID=103796 RepID=A0A2V0QDE0_PSESF|nr:hypothetical protein KPSA1_04630 [Pseudomonas syringae pv. actinidiae]